jgi:hypothetical protein
MHLHQPDVLSSTIPFAGVLVLMGVAALSAEFAPAYASVLITAALITVLLAIGYAALMSLGLALIALALVEVGVVVRSLERLSARKAMAALALGFVLGVVLDAGFFNWAARYH